MQLIDLRHLGRERVIGCWRVGEVLVDPGPSSCTGALLDALGDRQPRAIALTHIHLDHAGATGSLVRRFPHAQVWVHERGAPHLADPSRLLASAGRLYGEDMRRLWGDVLPVPAERLRVLSGGERIEGFEVAYTPGHASHHVSYLHEDSGRVLCGDVAGVRIATEGPVLAPTPPPDIDLRLWRESLSTIERWRPSALAPTHFGLYDDVAEHIARLRAAIDELERRARTLDAEQFAAALRADIRARCEPPVAAAYEQAMPPEQTRAGLARYIERAA
jgi:glyoxylase-like metal-dependent hydrolase (beta-lactamase superfamily II)